MNRIILLLTTLFLTTSVYAANDAPLSLKVFNANSNSFHVNSTLVYGDTEAAVIDAGFTKADALRIAANVLDSGKKLTTIFISQADPDFYFGAETLKKLFPEAKIIATPTVKKVIEKKMAEKVAYWAPKMGKNAPENVVTPDAYRKLSFFVDGHTIEIKGTTGLLAHRPYLWIPSIEAIVGDIAVFGGVHVWTADIQDKAEWNAWLLQLTEMKELSPKIVVPGHMKKGTKLDASNLQYTSTYLRTFEQAKENSSDSKSLINTMNALYPDSQFPLSLNIGAKVHKGEMEW